MAIPLFFRIVNALRFVLFFVYPLIPPLRGRIAFERKNGGDEASLSFLEEGRIADCAFEVSSEGELEQVRPLVDWILQRGERVEILFASPSVEKKCRELYERHREKVRILRMPLLLFFPWRLFGGQSIDGWLTASTLILCRYDFYPELFLYGTRGEHRLYLVSAGLKNKGRRWKPLYRLFDKIVCSNEEERRRFLDSGWPPDKLASYDFRSVRILSRLASREKTLEPWKGFVSWIKEFPEKNRLILGSAWPEEMELLRKTSLQKNIEKGQFLVLVVPHKMGVAFVKSLEEQMEGPPSYVLSRPDQWEGILLRWKRSPGLIFFNVSGFLLEFYTLFRCAVVGGGHGKGVHSLLEPFWAGCSIYCGPGIGRSSEYDFLRGQAPHRVKVVKDWKRLPKPEEAEEKIEWEHYLTRFEEVAKWLLDKKC